MQNNKTFLFLGATGAVGSVSLKRLLSLSKVNQVFSLGRREISEYAQNPKLIQQIIDIHQPTSYSELNIKADTAICTLGVGEPSKVDKTDFVAIDKTAVLEFAKVCKSKGVKHFQLLSSIGISSNSSNFYLRTKGELVKDLIDLNFERLSIFQPSMILTPTNRYGFTQWLTLKIWPMLNFFLIGKLRKYRGIKVDTLGKSIANNSFSTNSGIEYLQYDDFLQLENFNIS